MKILFLQNHYIPWRQSILLLILAMAKKSMMKLRNNLVAFRSVYWVSFKVQFSHYKLNWLLRQPITSLIISSGRFFRHCNLINQFFFFWCVISKFNSQSKNFNAQPICTLNLNFKLFNFGQYNYKSNIQKYLVTWASLIN